MNSNSQQSKIIPSLWVEKYRPKLVKDCVFPKHIKKTVDAIVSSGNCEHLLIVGSAGNGKTTLARALCNELDLDYIFINASDERNIDTIRTKVKEFASTGSLSGKEKAIILDEADGLGSTAQPALRAAMEEFHFVKFFLTANFKANLIKPIHSRCVTLDFGFNKNEKQDLMVATTKRVLYILKEENVDYDIAVVAEVIKKYFPDFRRLLNELQSYSRTGKIDAGMLTAMDKFSVSELVNYIKDKDLGKIKQWVADNESTDPAQFYRELFNELEVKLTTESICEAILILDDAQRGVAIAADRALNDLAMIVRIIGQCMFKG